MNTLKLKPVVKKNRAQTTLRDLVYVVDGKVKTILHWAIPSPIAHTIKTRLMNSGHYRNGTLECRVNGKWDWKTNEENKQHRS